jgi:integrase/recombinase XerC
MAVGRDGTPGSVGLHLAAGVPLLHPGEQVFAAMLEGWRAQQLARNLALATAGRREAMVRAFAAHADAFPWQWGPQMLDEWLGELRGVKGLRRSTVRAYASSVSAFCRYATDPAYGWAGQCQARFGNHPVQVVHEWNTAVHVQASEADPRKRAFTIDELQALFDHADTQVGRVRGGRKGWLPVFRDAAGLKVAYGFGLRRTEAAMLDVAGFGPNPHALEFGEYGVCQVRFGKAMKGSPPKASQRADRVGVGAAGAGAVDRRGPAVDAVGGGVGGAVAVRARSADRVGDAAQAVLRGPGRAGPG